MKSKEKLSMVESFKILNLCSTAKSWNFNGEFKQTNKQKQPPWFIEL